MIPPLVVVQQKFSELSVVNALDKSVYEDQIKIKLLSELGLALKDKVEFREYVDHANFHKTIEAAVCAMSYNEFQANYGYRNRGIADGTMAIMHNGHWKVLSGVTRPTPKIPQPVVKQKQSAIDYLTDRMRNS